jgi:hypothetical protein
VTDEEWDLVPLDKILDVLGRRFDAVVIAGCRTNEAGGNYYSIRYDGAHLECVGLAHYAAFDMTQDFNASIQEADS